MLFRSYAASRTIQMNSLLVRQAVLVGFTYLPAQEPSGSPKFFGVSLHTCHALARPRQTLHNLTLAVALFRLLEH